MPMNKISPDRLYGIRGHACHVDAQPPKQQDRVDNADLREDFCGPHHFTSSAVMNDLLMIIFPLAGPDERSHAIVRYIQ
jgi:hypothetical protein